MISRSVTEVGCAMLTLAAASGCAGFLELDEKVRREETISSGQTASTGAGGGAAPARPIDPCPDPATCAADLSTDSDNCGRCGRSCGGDPCQDGRCPTRVLAPTGLANYGLAVDATHVYWTAFQSAETGKYAVSKVPKAGGQVVTVFESADNKYWHPSGIAVDSQHVYWSTLFGTEDFPGAVCRATLDGGDLTELAYLGSPLATVVQRGDDLFVARTLGADTGGAVLRVDVDGGWHLVQSKLDVPGAMAIDETYLYWAIHGEQGRGIWRLDPYGHTPPELIAPTAEPVPVAVDGTFVYFYDFARQQLMRMKPDGSELTPIAHETSHSNVIAYAHRVYWVASDTGEIKSACEDGSDLQVLAIEQLPDAGTFTADEQNVYWIVAGELRTTRR